MIHLDSPWFWFDRAGRINAIEAGFNHGWTRMHTDKNEAAPAGDPTTEAWVSKMRWNQALFPPHPCPSVFIRGFHVPAALDRHSFMFMKFNLV